VADADAELVRRCRAGDPAALRAVVERFQGDVYGLCVRLLRHNQDAEDVAQEVFFRVFRSLHRWDASRPLRPWVIGIAVNRCRTFVGKRGKLPETADYLGEMTADHRTQDHETELHTAVREAVAELREDYRDVFVQFHEHGLPYDEIATAIGRPVGTIKTWLHRARLAVLERLRSKGLITEDPESVPAHHE
jgi:RNA polymerase sigma factor (sigma-70 family)